MSERVALSPASGPVVGALMHGLQILDLFTPDQPVLSVGEMARHLSLHKSTASRLAATLSAAGYLRPAGAPGRYELGAKIVRLAGIATPTAALPELARPALARLVEELGETGHIATLDGPDVVTVGVVDGSRTVRMHSRVGKRSPAHATAIGKALLAGLSPDEVRRLFARAELERRTERTVVSMHGLLTMLDEVRAAGYAVDTEELELGLCCVAAPVRDQAGASVAAVGISGPSSRITAAVRAELGHRVVSAADEVSSLLGAPASAPVARAT